VWKLKYAPEIPKFERSCYNLQVAVCVWVVLCRPGTHASSGASSGSSPAEPNSCLSDRGTLPTLDIVCGLKIQRLLGSARFGASLCPWGVLSRASGDFCAARRSALGLRFMVLLIHVLFVGAVFILSPVSPFPLYSLRVAACSRATVGMLLGGEDMHRFPVRSPRMDRDDLIRSPAARQIVSNYFGYPEHTPPLLAPLLRLFRFVSTSRPITLPRHRWTEQHVRADVGRAHPVPAEAHVRLRHLRVRRDGEGHPEQGQPALRVRRALVKPYKEKGKVPGRFRSVLPSSLLHCPLPACMHRILIHIRTSLQSHCNCTARWVALLVCFDSFSCHLKKLLFSILSFCLVTGSCSTRTMAEPSSLVARRPPDCWIPGTPTPSCFFQVPR
jgi:hypothetical protein